MAQRRKPRAATAPERLHRTVDVPQANKLENVRQLAAAVRDGVRDAAALLQMLDVDERHFAYYRQAAVILGVVTSSPEGRLALTERGRDLLATGEGSLEERACFLDAIRGARALKPFTSFFLGEELAPEEIAKRLQSFTDLSFSTAKRRAATLLQWRKYVTSRPSHVSGPAVPDVASEIEARVKRHNALAKQELKAWLQQIDPTEFEKIVARLFAALGYVDVKPVGGARDGGVDVEAARLGPGQHREPIAVQVKRYSHPVGPRVVRELIGTVATGRYVKGILVTTSEFTTQAQEEGARDVRIQLITGLDLVDLLAENGVAVRYGKYQEISAGE
jgi:hypothetical protein